MSKNKKENQNQLDDKSNNIIIVPSLKDKINPQSFKFNINPGNSCEKQKIDDLIDQTPRPQKNKKVIIISAISISVFLIILVIVLLVGHFKYGWFKKKNDLIIEQNRAENLVAEYKEKNSI